MVRAHIFFSGTVQGVGFRYTCLSFAQELSLTGWVKNLADGRVEVIVEGPRESVEGLVSRLKTHFEIREQNMDWAPHQGEFKGFSIK